MLLNNAEVQAEVFLGGEVRESHLIHEEMRTLQLFCCHGIRWH